MEIKTRHIISRDKKEITLMLYGVIGVTVDGDYLAQELEWIDRNYDTVILRINSDGGYVTQGLSIVSQLLQMKAFTVAKIDGVAASMAAVIPVACDKVIMNDYARMMIHSPYMVDDKMKAVKMSEKEKKAAMAMKGILTSLLSKRGKSEEEISKLLNDETWYTAEEAMAAGFVHEIAVTGRKGELADMLPAQLVACLEREVFTNSNSNMKQICAKVGLPETSDEAAILAKMEEMETAQADRQKKLVDRYLELGRKSGAVTDDNAEKMRRLAAADFDLFVELLKLDAITSGQQERISGMIANLGGKDANDTRDWDWYQRNDPAALAAMENAEPVKFKKLQEAYYANLK